MSRFFLLLLSISFFLNFSCKKENKKTPYAEYFKLDITESTEKLFAPKKKATIPFAYNKIYDPFLNEDSTITKSVYEKGKHNKIKITVLDTVVTSINVASRKKNEKYTQGLPVIIENTAKLRSKHLLLHRGGALIIQEVLNTKGKWIPIEHKTKEKIGNYYYLLLPKKYIYTKVPKYKGTEKTKFRVKLFLDEETVVYSNEYEGNIQKWMLR